MLFRRPGKSMDKRVFAVAALSATMAASSAALTPAAGSPERDDRFFKQVKGTWSGPGEIVAGKYKGTKFTCNFEGETPNGEVGMSLDGTCRVGVFTQKMSASVIREGGDYRGKFMDGVTGEGLDITSGVVDGRRVVFSINRRQLNGAMLAGLPDDNTMNLTVSMRVDRKLVPVIGMRLKRVDGNATGSVARK